MTEARNEYGTALYMLARECEAENEYSSALEFVQKAFSENPQYLDLLSSPAISLSEKLSALEAAFQEEIPENVLSFIKLLCEKGRIYAFEVAVEEYNKLLNMQNKISAAFVKSAIPLTDEEKEKLKNKLEIKTGNSIIMECSVDESLMGGIIIELDGTVIDGSLKNRLHKVKDVISQ